MTDSLSLYTGHNLTVGSNNDPLLDKLIIAINHASIIGISVSFIMKSGLNLLFDALLDALNRGAELRLLTSDYLSVTQPVALRELILLVDKGANIRVFQCKGNISFHLKSYIFIKSHHNKIDQGCAWIGSNNMSKMALTEGHEWALRFDYKKPDNSKAALEFHHIRQQFEHLFTHSLTHSLSHKWIDAYNVRYKKQNPHFIRLITTETESELDSFVPNSIQTEALIALEQTRLNGYQRGLVVLATGMGKTWLSAFDAKQMNAKRVLFVAHREEILLQAERTFIQLNENIRTGRYNGTSKDTEADYLFASIQTIGRREHLTLFDKKHFDYVIVDEFHHASSSTYQALLAYFTPTFLLGLTATPERSDQADILSLCDNNLVFERNLVHGIDNKILVPFDYYGIYDQYVNYQEIPWRNGKFDPAALDTAFATQQRAQHILKHWEAKKQTRTLAFCISKKHADYMAKFFCNKGYKAVVVYNDSTMPRNEALTALQNGVIDIIFSVDLFNEGTDIPSIDTILMIRPTESKILFLQQLGRGLRQSKNTQKDKLLVLDFIGNHQSFLTKPSALLDISSTLEIAQRSAKSITLTDDCFINFDPELTKFWQELASRYKTSSIEEYRELKNILDHRPTATEFMQANYRLDKVKQQHGSWFSLVAEAEEEQTPEMAHLVNNYGKFLHNGIAQTAMTKCFKAILLEAFLNLDGFSTPPTTASLAEQSLLVLNRYPELKIKDVAKTEQQRKPTAPQWHQYWLKNPIKAYTTENKNREQWFSIINDRFTANFNVAQEDKQQLHKAVKELVDLRLAQYVQRNTKNTIYPSFFRCK